MNKINFIVLAENRSAECSRCGSNQWPCIGIHVTGGPDQALCIKCLAYAIDAVTGWKITSIISRYRDISPLFKMLEPVPQKQASSKKSKSKKKGSK